MLKSDVKMHFVIMNGTPREEDISDYTTKGYVHLATLQASQFHPYAMDTDTIVFFAVPIDKEAYDKEMKEIRESHEKLNKFFISGLASRHVY